MRSCRSSFIPASRTRPTPKSRGAEKRSRQVSGDNEALRGDLAAYVICCTSRAIQGRDLPPIAEGRGAPSRGGTCGEERLHDCHGIAQELASDDAFVFGALNKDKPRTSHKAQKKKGSP